MAASRTRRTILGLETLDDRLLLSGVFNPPPPPVVTPPAPVAVTPPGHGLPPIILPLPTSLPGGLSPIPLPPGTPPPGLPELAGTAEEAAANAGIAFMTQHPGAQVAAVDHLFANGVFAIAIVERDSSGDIFAEDIVENRGVVTMNMVEISGGQGRFITAAQLTGHRDHGAGYMFDMQTSPGHLPQLNETVEFHGREFHRSR